MRPWNIERTWGMCGQGVENVKTGVQKTTQEGDREIDREYMMSVIASSTHSGQSKQLWGGGVCISVRMGPTGGNTK